MDLARTSLLLACLSAVACSDASFAVGASQSDDGLVADAREDGAGDAPGIDAPDTGSPPPSDTAGGDTGSPPPDTGLSPDTGAPVDTGALDTGKVDAPVCGPPAVDLDGDGEAPPPGVCGTDCHDGNKDVFSKQWKAFATPYTTVGGGSSFDYNCDGVETRVFGKKFTCIPTGTSGCTGTPGYLTDVVPACGAMTDLVSSCKREGATCVPAFSNPYKQECN